MSGGSAPSSGDARLLRIVHQNAEGTKEWDVDMGPCFQTLEHNPSLVRSPARGRPLTITLQWSPSSDNWICRKIE